MDGLGHDGIYTVEFDDELRMEFAVESINADEKEERISHFCSNKTMMKWNLNLSVSIFVFVWKSLNK
jgi:hypothetical protein